jgi:hypothetical protein
MGCPGGDEEAGEAAVTNCGLERLSSAIKHGLENQSRFVEQEAQQGRKDL